MANNSHDITILGISLNVLLKGEKLSLLFHHLSEHYSPFDQKN
jgi:hypothetical protein